MLTVIKICVPFVADLDRQTHFIMFIMIFTTVYGILRMKILNDLTGVNDESTITIVRSQEVSH